MSLQKGRLLGGATRLQEVYVDSEIRAFGAMRTLGFQADVAQVVDPCVGLIRAVGRSADRQP